MGGSFTLFMFIPKEYVCPRDSFKDNLDMLKQFWGQDISNNTLHQLAKTNLFLPKSAYHLKIQLATAVQSGCSKHCLYRTM